MNFGLQPMNVFRFGSQAVQQNQSLAQRGVASGPFGGGAPAHESLSSKMGESFNLLSPFPLVAYNYDTACGCVDASLT